MKKTIVLLAALALVLAFAGCGKKAEVADSKVLKVGIVLSIGGLGDKSFNDAAYRGLEMAKKDLGIEFNYVEPASPAEDEQFLRQYAEAGYDVVFAIGFLMHDSCEKVAKEFPNVKFAIVDSVIELPNVASLTFKEHEGSFLVGAIAAMVSKTGSIGFIGGMDVPLIRKFQAGFEQGVKYVNPGAKVIALYTTSANPFNDPVKGKENTLTLINQGADVVYHAAGATGAGVFEACKEMNEKLADDKKVWAIGVDSNQDGIVPGTILTSMMKYVDVAVYNTVKDVKEGKFSGKVYSFGVAEGGVGTTDFEFSKDRIPADALTKLKEIEEKIKSGEIKVKEQL